MAPYAPGVAGVAACATCGGVRRGRLRAPRVAAWRCGRVCRVVGAAVCQFDIVMRKTGWSPAVACSSASEDWAVTPWKNRLTSQPHFSR